MAIIHITTTHGAVSPEERASLAANLATLTYEAEGFAGSAVAPTLCWTLLDERPRHAFSTGAGDPAEALCYVTVTILAGAMDWSAKRKLGADITAAVLARKGGSPTPENRKQPLWPASGRWPRGQAERRHPLRPRRRTPSSTERKPKPCPTPLPIPPRSRTRSTPR